VLIQKVMQQLTFRPYIRGFAMSAGCIMLPDTCESIQVEMCDIIERIETVSLQLSECQDDQALLDDRSFMALFFRLKEKLDLRGWVESILEPGDLSGGGIKNRLFCARIPEPPKKPTAEKPSTAEPFADEQTTPQLI
jgi:hypothetical protein